MGHKKLLAVVAGLAGATLTLAGCGSTASDTATPSATATEAAIKICVYTHGDGGSFWTVAQKGAEAAAAKLGVTLDYQGSTNDAAKQAATIDAGIVDVKSQFWLANSEIRLGRGIFVGSALIQRSPMALPGGNYSQVIWSRTGKMAAD